MSSKLTRSFHVVPLSFGILIVLLALAALAQISGGQGFQKSPLVLTRSTAGEHSQPEGTLLSASGTPGRAPVSRARGIGLGPMAPDNPLFLPAQPYYLGGGGLAGLVTDMNGDGKLDLLVSGTDESNGDGSVGVLLGNGDGTLQGRVGYYNTGGQAAAPPVVADLNGDGKPDLVVAESCASWLGNCTSGDALAGVLLNNGDGTFQPAVVYRTGGYTFALSAAVGDVNGDGKPDLVVADWTCTNGGGEGCVSVLLGNGNGTFQTARTYDSGGSHTESIVATDVNGDGKLDLLVTNGFGSDSVGVLLGNGDGTFQSSVAYLSGGDFAKDLLVVDVNHDGKPDLIVTNIDSDTIGVLLGKGDGTFRAAKVYSSGGQGITSIVAADVNGDGTPDLLATNCGAKYGFCGGNGGGVGVLLANGDGTFRPAVTYDLGGRPVQIEVGDVNADGKQDLVATVASFGTIGVLLGDGDGTFQPIVSYDSGLYVDISVRIADMNGDGKLDAVVTGWGPGGRAVGVLLNNRAADYSASRTTLTSSADPAGINQGITYTATVTNPSGGTVTGMITFQDGGATIATVPLANNQAAYSTSYIQHQIGGHTITAAYSGDAANNFSSATLTEFIRGWSTVVLTTSGSPSFVGQPVTFTATVTSKFGAIPDGELVTFYDGKTALASVALAGGTAAYTTSSLSARTHAIKAAYVGDNTFAPSAKTVSQVVEKYSTTTTLTSSPNPSNFGQAVTFTAHVKSAGPSAPTGKVKFLDGTTGIASVTLSGGVAKLTKSMLAVGTHAITAEYLGDAASATSTSSVLNQVVQ